MKIFHANAYMSGLVRIYPSTLTIQVDEVHRLNITYIYTLHQSLGFRTSENTNTTQRQL